MVSRDQRRWHSTPNIFPSRRGAESRKIVTLFMSVADRLKPTVRCFIWHPEGGKECSLYYVVVVIVVSPYGVGYLDLCDVIILAVAVLVRRDRHS